MKIYAFEYTYCIHEDSMSPISLHRTKKGAYKAMREFLEGSYMEWYNHRIMYGKERGWIDKFENHSAWQVSEIKVEE